jgi:hypothetical protein
MLVCRQPYALLLFGGELDVEMPAVIGTPPGRAARRAVVVVVLLLLLLLLLRWWY